MTIKIEFCDRFFIDYLHALEFRNFAQNCMLTRTVQYFNIFTPWLVNNHFNKTFLLRDRAPSISEFGKKTSTSEKCESENKYLSKVLRI